MAWHSQIYCHDGVRLLRWFANSMKLLSKFIEFTQQIH